MPTIHARSVWQDPALPIKGPPLPWSQIGTIAPHYTAAVNLIDGDLGEHADNLPGYLRAIQRDYMNRKPTGYSIGYNWAIDWLGGIWECRGWDIKSAAQGFPLNDHVVAVLFLVDGNDEPTAEAMESFRFLNRQARKLAGEKLWVMDHGRLPGAKTACAGSGIRRVVDRGWLDDEYDPNPPPVVTPDPVPQPPVEDDMKIAILKPQGAYAIFLAETTQAGIALNVRWSGEGTAKVQSVIDAHVAAGAEVRSILISDLRNCFLLGPLPKGDPAYNWTLDDFAG